MKIIYLLNQRFPTEKAYGRQVSKMCLSFAKIPGVDLELIYPTRQSLIKDDPFDYYGIRKNFKISRIRAPDFYWPGRLEVLAFSIKSLLSAFLIARIALVRKPDLIYSRDELPLYVLSFLRLSVVSGFRMVFEAHKIQTSRSFMYRRFIRNRTKIIVITSSLKEGFVKLGFDPKNILITPDGVDAETIAEEEKSPADAKSIRKTLDLPLDKKIAVYAGSLYKWKGVYTLADAAKLSPETLFIIVGGDERGDETDLRDYLKDNKIQTVSITGHIRSEDTIRKYLSTADVLVLPNTAKDIVSSKYTSPLKLFSYMAARRPIVASDLVSLREILNENNSVLVKADDAKALAEGVRKILNDRSLADRISQSAFNQVKQYTWGKRAEKILNFTK